MGAPTEDSGAAAVPRNQSAHDPALWREKQPADFTWSKQGEPHVRRRGEILKKHPEIKELYTADPASALFTVATVAVQLTMAWLVQDWSWLPLLIVTWAVSGTCNHSLFLAMHELSHDLFFKTKYLNHCCAMFANLPQCIATAATFRRYHLEHHSSQGVDGVDMDIALPWEGRFFNTTPRRVLYMALMPFFYSLRPLVCKPKPLSTYELVNWAVIIVFDYWLLTTLGGKSFFYLFMGNFLGLGIHPLSGHFIAEHYEFIEGQETYSYYGPGNAITYNVGYHNEHHDFPRVPGRLLPKVKELAPEYYETLPSYTSWSRVVFDFMTGKPINPFCRVKRTAEAR